LLDQYIWDINPFASLSRTHFIEGPSWPTQASVR
jgi:hypothetical protein